MGAALKRNPLGDKNLETFSLVWLDGSVNTSQENLDVQQQLRTFINHLVTFENSNTCEHYIRAVSNQDRIILIVSGRLGKEIVPRIHYLRQVSSIYVYCMNKEKNEEWANPFDKVKGVIVNLDELVAQIRTNRVRRNNNNIDESCSISIFNTHVPQGELTTGSNGQFIHSQLLIDCLLRMKASSTDKNELILLSKQEYQGNKTELKILHDFERHYSPDRALWWFTRDSFLSRLLIKTARVQNVDMLVLFRFFIRDIRQQLEQYKCSSSIRVYRSQLMSNEELNVLKDSIGEFISPNAFLSTHPDRQKALAMLNDDAISKDLERVLFVIDADPRLDGVKPFANITSHSYFPKDNEVLFMLGSIFHLVDIHHEEKQYWTIQLTLSSDNDHLLKSIFKRMKSQNGNGETTRLSIGHLLLDVGKADEAEKYYRRYLSELPHDHPDLMDCYYALGNVADNQEKYETSLEWHTKSLELKQRILKSDDSSLGDSHNSIGEVYRKKRDYKNALESYLKALDIWERSLGKDHPKLGMCFNNIGCIYGQEKKYSETLDYHQRALAIMQKHFPPDHPCLGQSHHNIGSVHQCLGDYDLALEHYHLSLNIKSKCLPAKHISIASTLHNIGAVYELKDELEKALDSYQKAASIYRHTVPPTYPDAFQLERNIQRISSKIEQQSVLL